MDSISLPCFSFLLPGCRTRCDGALSSIPCARYAPAILICGFTRRFACSPLSLPVVTCVFQVLGLALTAFRIYFRIRIGRFWWEDGWAATMLLSGLLWMISQWGFLLTTGSTSIVFSWTYMISFTCIIAAGRMSILFSIIRIIPGSSRLKKFTYLCVAFFAACWIILTVEKVWQCAADRSWEHVPVASEKPFSDFVADLILVVLPLCMLWKVRLPRRQRRMILSIFASSIVMTIGALFHTLGQVFNDFLVMTTGVNVEIALALIVCNLLVVVTYTYRFLLQDSTSSSSSTEDTTDGTSASGDQDDDFTRPTRQPRTTTLNLTTVDLSLDSGCQDEGEIS
ncbi:hypothetical protein BU15DRAFT_46946 [Melanogaster broomeanus]|nr:hypothetical protein BU15DRAFT_46946 [Melanogaster broomeanus]